jgi:hypothetical protein
MAANLNVVAFPVPEYRDPAKMLRNIADEIEAGEHGEVGTIAIAVFGDTMEVFGGGPDSDGPTCALVFQAAALRFTQEIERHGRD